MSEKGAVEFLAFISLEGTLAKDGYIGAVLVTDLLGVPEEFRCTHPVKPTLVQNALYGAALKPHIAVELCGKPLLKLLQKKPSIAIVKDEILLGLRPATSCPVVFVRKAGEAIEIKSTGTGRAPSTIIEAPHDRFQPITIITHPEYADDFSLARKIVEEAFSHFDLIEPFERIAKAVEMLAKQDERFR